METSKPVPVYSCWLVVVHHLFSLLDVGPTAEGDIIAPMADNLLAAGQWLKYAGDCVYATVRIVCICDETRV